MAELRSLGALMAAQRVGGLQERVRIARALAASLAALHERGEAHGALDADAVLIERRDGDAPFSVTLVPPRRKRSRDSTAPKSGSDPTPRDDAFEFGAILTHLMRERPLAANADEPARAVPPAAPGPQDDDSPRIRELVATLLTDPAVREPPGFDEVVRILDATLADLNSAPDGEERLGMFHILCELRMGATGRAVLARRHGVGDDVVLKIARIGDQDTGLRREIAALERVRHPNVARAIGGHLFAREGLYVGEFVRAPGNDGYRRAGLDLRSDRIATVARGLMLAIASVHAAGYLHRDVKPSNIVIDDDGHVTLLDFGLVSIPGDTELATTSTPFTSPMLPERGYWSHADDVFAALVSLWHVMTGRHPWSWDKASDVTVLRDVDLFPIFGRASGARITERFRALLARPPDGEGAARKALALLHEVLR